MSCISETESVPRRGRWAAFALLAAVALLPDAAHAAAPAESRPPSIEVSAEGQVDVPADLAALDFGVAT